MSRPRFLADHDFNEHIIDGVLRREPTLDFVRVRDFGLEARPDPEVLDFAAAESLIVVSHDVNTMVGHASARIASGAAMSGLLMIQQTQPILPVIESLLLIWIASEVAVICNPTTFLRPFCYKTKLSLIDVCFLL
jgi:hypothetical protein